MRAEEIEAVAAALGEKVTGVRTLAGGFSHETCLLELGSDRVVVRLGGADPAVEAAVMSAARGHVPVPDVLRVLPPPAAGGTRPAMVLAYVAGTALSEVLAGGGPDTAGLGAEVGHVFGAVGAAAAFGRPGFFADATLAVADMPPWSQQLPQMAADSMAATPGSRLAPAARRAWTGLCAAHAPALAAVDQQARLVHADANPKNVLVTRLAAGWRVDAVLDWEFSFSGCPYADYANMTRFSGDYPPGFTRGFRAGFAEHHGDGDPQDWAYLGRVMDMFALSDLVTRPEGHPVADQAAAEIRRWIAGGVPDAPEPPL